MLEGVKKVSQSLREKGYQFKELRRYLPKFSWLDFSVFQVSWAQGVKYTVLVPKGGKSKLPTLVVIRSTTYYIHSENEDIQFERGPISIPSKGIS